MSLLTTLRKDKMQALKDKDTVKNGICSLLISAIALAEKEAGQPLSAEEELAYVQKELKQTKDTLAQTPASRPELIAETQRKIEIIEAYLPAQMSEAELDDALRAVIAELQLEPVMKNKGTLIKAMMARYKGKTDGKSVNAAVGRLKYYDITALWSIKRIRYYQCLLVVQSFVHRRTVNICNTRDKCKNEKYRCYSNDEYFKPIVKL